MSLNKLHRSLLRGVGRCLLAGTPLVLVGGLLLSMHRLALAAEAQEDAAAEPWVYGDPLESTTPTNFHPQNRRDLRPPRSEEDAAALAARLRAAYAEDPAAWPPAHVDEGVEAAELGPPEPAAYPKANPHSEAKATLGRLLFFDGRLSGSGQMSCASCHTADLGWADGRARSLGHAANQLGRNTPSLLNSGLSPTHFWDGRAEDLETLIREVLSNGSEMKTTPEEAAARVAAVPGYAAYFAEAFGDAAVTADRLVDAIATHTRTVVSEPSSDFDRFLAGDHDRLSDAAVRGLHLFRTDARCFNCHHGPRLTDDKFHNLGLTYYGRLHEDLGRYRVTDDPADVGQFKTPGLRNVARTAPYMHNGFFDLEGLINVYNAVGADPKRPEKFADDPLWPTTDPLLRPLHLNERDRADLLAFLESLTERRRRDMQPDLPE